MTWVAVAIGGSALLGYAGSKSAAGVQADAANNASGIQKYQYDTTRNDLAPYRNAGPVALADLMNRLGLGGTQSRGAQPTRDQFTKNIAAIPGMQSGGITGREPSSYAPSPGQPARTEFDQAGYDQAMAGWNAQPQGGGDANTGQLLKPFGMDDFQESPAYRFNLAEGEKAINKAANARGNLYAPQTLQDLGKYSQGQASNEFQNAYSNYNNNLNNIWNRLYGITGMGQSAANQTGAFGANAANNIASNTMGAGNAQAAGIMGGANALAGGIGDAYNQYLLSSVLRGQQPTYGAGSGGNFSNQG